MDISKNIIDSYFVNNINSSYTLNSNSIFDEIIIAIGVNADKKQLFSLEDKIQQIKNTFINEPKIKVASYKGLTIDFCKSVNSKYILRGLRNSSDFNYEQSIAQTNSSLSSIESVFLISSPQLAHISSTIVRDIIKNEGDYKSLVPESVII